MMIDRLRRLFGYQFPRGGPLLFRGFFACMPRFVDTELVPGIHARLDLSDGIQRVTYWQGRRFERETIDQLCRWGRSATHFFDIGSNYGFLSYWVAHECPHLEVDAFEPNPETFSTLERICADNHLDRIHPWNLGLSDEPGRLRLLRGTTDSGHSTFGPHPDLHASHEAAVTSFEAWRRERGLRLPQRPHWIAKIDVEGFELKVLRGMEASLRSRAFLGLVVEINPFTQRFCGIHLREVFGWLADCGYAATSPGLPSVENWPDTLLRNVAFEPTGAG
jgi:FkbM family methyltransferase